MKEETFLAYQAQAEGLIADQARLIADQKRTIEELKEAVEMAAKTIDEIRRANPN